MKPFSHSKISKHNHSRVVLQLQIRVIWSSQQTIKQGSAIKITPGNEKQKKKKKEYKLLLLTKLTCPTKLRTKSLEIKRGTERKEQDRFNQGCQIKWIFFDFKLENGDHVTIITCHCQKQKQVKPSSALICIDWQLAAQRRASFAFHKINSSITALPPTDSHSLRLTQSRST